MVTPAAALDTIERVGGRLCLDFVNTRASHYDADARDYLGDYGNLIDWLRGCEDGLDARETARLATQARAHPRLAAAALASARDLRSLLYRIFAAVAAGHAPARADVDELNGQTMAANSHRYLAPGERWHWRWSDEDDLDLPSWKALVSAAELLVGDDLAQLKQCPAPDGCGWLFYDTSKNHTRRWCSMRMCGNGAKARRFQRRLRDRKRRLG